MGFGLIPVGYAGNIVLPLKQPQRTYADLLDLHAEILIEQIQRIQSELPKHTELSPEEKAFNDAAEEHFEAVNSQRNKFVRH